LYSEIRERIKENGFEIWTFESLWKS
jgi:hypothetical protein